MADRGLAYQNQQKQYVVIRLYVYPGEKNSAIAMSYALLENKPTNPVCVTWRVITEIASWHPYPCRDPVAEPLADLFPVV
jgi:hypothetical protein